MVLCTLGRDKSTNPIHHPLVALDVENNPQDGKFICASLYGERKDKHGKKHQVDEFFDSQEELCGWIIKQRDAVGVKNIPFWIVVFNGGYDHVFLESIIDDNTLFYAGSRFITARITTAMATKKEDDIKKGKSKKGIKIIDLCNHCDGTLENWIIDLKMEEKYGIRKESLENLKLRNRYDTMATWYLGRFIEDYYYSLNISMKLTIGSCALNLYRKRFYDLFIQRDSDFINDYERKAFRGGRVEVFMRGLRKVKSYDVNSMYLSIMENEYIPDPCTYRFYQDPKNWEKDFNNPSYMGIYHVKVSALKQKIMCLPYIDTETKKLIFPWGTFSGYWTDIELKEALKNGYEIQECYDYVIYTQQHKMFSEYAKYIWSERQRYKKEGNRGMDLLIKKLGNALFGKFVQKNKGGYAGKLDDYTGILPENISIYTRDGVEYISISDNAFEESDHSFPVIGVFITSYARLKLYRKMKQHENSLVYCDTDSVKYLNDNIDIETKENKDLGAWGFEYEKELSFFRPKMYGSEKIKGVPKRASVYSILNDRSVHAVYEKPIRWKESIRRHETPNKWVLVDKELSFDDDKRIWFDDNTSDPLYINEEERVSEKKS
jgi:hypothetical protein